MRTAASLVFGALLLGGCAAPYVEPTSGPMATLQLVNSSQSGPVFPAIYAQALGCAGRAQLPQISEGERSSVRIKAGRTTAITMFLGLPGTGYCPITWSFAPRADAKYTASVDAVGSGCYLRLRDVTDPAAEFTPEFTTHHWKRPLVDGGGWCDY